MRIIQIIFKWLTLSFIGIVLLSIIIGQIFPIELKDGKNVALFYKILIIGIPTSILLTMIWIIKPEKTKKRNIIIGISAPIIAFLSFYILTGIILFLEVGFWENEWILYQNKANPDITINQQALDLGQLGIGGVRTVKLKPFLGLWLIVTKVDTSSINKSEWNSVNRFGGFHKGF